eukprot:scaffold113414_cov68-Phaeocystis_antarctica.AAC.2
MSATSSSRSHRRGPSRFRLQACFRYRKNISTALSAGREGNGTAEWDCLGALCSLLRSAALASLRSVVLSVSRLGTRACSSVTMSTDFWFARTPIRFASC